MSSAFQSPLDIRCLTRDEARARKLQDSRVHFRLLAPLHYTSELLARDIVVPAGFVTDLGSIPRAVWWWLSPDDYDISYPSVVHDYLYHAHGFIGITRRIDRQTADRVLVEAMAAVGATAYRRAVVYRAVRIGGPRW